MVSKHTTAGAGHAPPRRDGAPAPEPPQPAPPAKWNAVSEGLGILNRHWYRRCLDALSRTLVEVGSEPSVEQLNALGDRVVTDFLTAVTGQAPNSPQPQFPADRAFYIPFEGDNAGKFNFAKPYFQFVGPPEGFESLEHSLWSFLPWSRVEGSGYGLAAVAGRERMVEIAHLESINDEGQTISFEEMISAPARVASDSGWVDPDKLRLRKSLLLRGREDSLAAEVFGEERERAAGAGLPVRKLLKSAIVHVFEIYKAAPGNAAIELLLQNHLNVLRWLDRLAHSPEPEARGGRMALSQQDEDYKTVLLVLLATYYLDDASPDPGASPEEASGLEPRKAQLLNTLRDWVIPPEKSGPPAEPDLRRLAADLCTLGESRFLLAVNQRRKAAPGMLVEDVAWDELKENRPHFVSFYKYFLKSGFEADLEANLAASTADDPRRAGKATESFVWVCPDFQDLDDSLPKADRPGRGWAEQVRGLEARLAEITRPYRWFFRKLESLSLARYDSRISNYWRTRLNPNRKDWVFGSFDSERRGLIVEPRQALGGVGLDDPRPQNIFLRVKVCDSLNEPFINGLFVFTSDHDEVRFKHKDPAVRGEDVDDLLAFAKVFFFIVRDHIHGLDRARDAADIGRLNQHLYDRRLASLDRRMNDHLAGFDSRALDVAHRENWPKFVYDVLNNYAYSLLDKPDEVRIETFPYDRLLILPLGDRGAEDSSYDLPFYLFQCVFVERVAEKIDGNHYSLLKPFQSPVEQIDAKSPDRFEARSFQKTSESRGVKETLHRFLEKHYVGASGPGASEGGEPGSSAVKSDAPGDWGATWARRAVRRFWERTRKNADLWCEFLGDLTRDYRDLVESRLPAEAARPTELWFFLRFSLLRGVLREIAADDPDLEGIRRRYLQDELKLRFDDKQDLDLLFLATTAERERDPFAVLARGNKRAALQGDPLKVISFEEYFVRGRDPLTSRPRDPLMVKFFEHLTHQVMNDDEHVTADDGTVCRTFYQKLLTRPFERLGPAPDDGRPRSAAGQIGKRIPAYEAMEKGDDAVAMFLGVVNLTTGQNRLEVRQFRCLIAMMRDFDDSRTGLEQSEKEVRAKLQKDRDDLTLFTRMFFQNVHRFLTTAREREQVRSLSIDIVQIARNWYSSGADAVAGALQEQLQRMVQRRQVVDFGRLRGEIVDRLFTAMLAVLLRREFNSNDQSIDLESFPFDRLLHVPLLSGPTDAARLCYARTTVARKAAEGSDPDPHGISPGGSGYGAIRERGRHEVLGAGKKILHAGSPVLGIVGAEVLRQPLRAGADPAGRTTSLDAIIKDLTGSERTVDAFVRRLYRENALQTLTLAGTLCELLKRPVHERKGGGGLWDPAHAEFAARLRGVIEASVQGLERTAVQGSVLTAVHMDRGLALGWRPTGGPDRAEAALGSKDSLPFFRELFAAVEGDDPESTYGLAEGVKSKVFYVYYSIPAPDGFMEQGEPDARYRGVFCFVVDDAATDEKTGGAGLNDFSWAERADQEDIRTFVHNIMGSLRLVLGQQEMQDRLLQPGVEQFVDGMLHRLKNDLSVPSAALVKVRNALERPRPRAEGVRDLVASIGDAQATIDRVDELFHNLKRLSELQGNVVPLQAFSSDWLGWSFVADLCHAMIEQVGRAGPGGPSPTTREKVRANVEAIRRRARAERDRDQPRTGVVPRVQRELTKVEGELQRLLGGGVDVFLSYQVFAPEPLHFRGSYLLAEAVNTLFENAFQALWAYAEKRRGSRGGAPTVAHLGLTCRPGGSQPGEILLEIRNSSDRIDEENLRIFNAEIPKPLTSQQHRKGSGKKGGSGFGHYFARRVVEDFCGGRAAQQQLRVDFANDAAADQVVITVALLRAADAEPVQVPRDDLISAAEGAFHEVAASWQSELADGPSGARRSYLVPGDTKIIDLFDVARRLLAADREARIDDLFAYLRDSVCGELKDSTERLKEALLKALRSPADGPRARMEAVARDLDGNPDLRVESFHDLARWLKALRSDDGEVLDELARRDHGFSEALAALLQDGVLRPAQILPEDARDEFAERVSAFRPFLHAGEAPDLLTTLMEELGTDAEGRPQPTRVAVSGAFKRGEWECRVRAHGPEIRFAFHLFDGPPVAPIGGDGDRRLSASESTPRDGLGRAAILDKYQDEFLGRAFVQYQESLEALEQARPGGGGSLWFVRRDADPAGVAPSLRSVYLRLAVADEPGHRS
jgi:hypothetical protein